MKKTMLASVVVGVLLVSLVSAGLVDYLSNIVSGSVVAEGPVFYATGEDSSENSNNRLLSINKFVGNSDYTQFTNGGTNKWFVTEELGIDSFYDANYNFDVELCAENKTVDDLVGQVTLTLKVLKENGDFRYDALICIKNINDVPTTDNCLVADYKIYPVSCVGNSFSLDETDRLVWIMNDGSHKITYRIKLDGDTKISVTTD